MVEAKTFKLPSDGYKVIVLAKEGNEWATEEVVDGMIRRVPNSSKFKAWSGILTRNPRRERIYVVMPIKEEVLNDKT